MPKHFYIKNAPEEVETEMSLAADDVQRLGEDILKCFDVIKDEKASKAAKNRAMNDLGNYCEAISEAQKTIRAAMLYFHRKASKIFYKDAPPIVIWQNHHGKMRISGLSTKNHKKAG